MWSGVNEPYLTKKKHHPFGLMPLLCVRLYHIELVALLVVHLLRKQSADVEDNTNTTKERQSPDELSVVSMYEVG